MGKKRRQHDTNVEGSEESTESGEGYNSMDIFYINCADYSWK